MFTVLLTAVLLSVTEVFTDVLEDFVEFTMSAVVLTDLLFSGLLICHWVELTYRLSRSHVLVSEIGLAVMLMIY